MNFYLCIWFKMYKLRDWVDETRLCISLSLNERAVEYLENHENLIDNSLIFQNANAIHIIEKRIQYDRRGDVNCNKGVVNFLRNNRQYIDYCLLCKYEHGIEFVDELIKNNELHKIKWRPLSENPAAIYILNDPKYHKYIDWAYTIFNKNAVESLKNHLPMIDGYWVHICRYPYLIDIIEQNMDKIVWSSLSLNYNAIHILEKNIDKIHVEHLCLNKNGFELLLQLGHVFMNHIRYHKNIVLEYFDYCEKKNIRFALIHALSLHGYTEKHMDVLQKGHYWYLSQNPNIFEYDYNRMRETRQSLLWYNDIKK